jgi:hypothetical protein
LSLCHALAQEFYRRGCFKPALFSLLHIFTAALFHCYAFQRHAIFTAALFATAFFTTALFNAALFSSLR